jgi:hypothetical protein
MADLFLFLMVFGGIAGVFAVLGFIAEIMERHDSL